MKFVQTESTELSHPTESTEFKLNTLRILLVERKLKRDVVDRMLRPLERLSMLSAESVENTDAVERREQKLHADNIE